MVQGLQSWIVNICSAVLFMTAVEIVLPDNSMKKYTRFVLGLILITVVLNPIISVMSNGVKNLSAVTLNNSDIVSSKNNKSNYSQYRDENIKNTLSTIKNNLEVSLVKELKEKFPGENFQTEIEVGYDDKNDEMSIEHVKVNMKSKGVEKVKKVDINSPPATEIEASDSKSLQIKSYVCTLLKVPEKSVKIIKD